MDDKERYQEMAAKIMQRRCLDLCREFPIMQEFWLKMVNPQPHQGRRMWIR